MGRGTEGGGTTVKPQRRSGTVLPNDYPGYVVPGRLGSGDNEVQEAERWRAVRTGERGALVTRACCRTLPRSSPRGAGVSFLNV